MTAPDAPEPIVYCATHPGVETALECGRCERPICPRCMVFTPGGVRCQDCAMLRRPPMYELTPSHYLRAVAAASLVAVALGVAGAILLPPGRSIPFFGLMLSVLAGVGAATLVAEAISRATRGKRGLPLQLIAAGALLGAGALRLVLLGGLAFLLRGALADVLGLLMLGVAVVAAWQRLR